jgi:hypothetical protein
VARPPTIVEKPREDRSSAAGGTRRPQNAVPTSPPH